MKQFIKVLACLLVPMLISRLAYTQQVIITTNVMPPFSSYIRQAFNTVGRSINITLREMEGKPINIALYAKLERIAPEAFTLELNETYIGNVISLGPLEQRRLTSRDLQDAFGNFSSDFLRQEGDIPGYRRDTIDFKIPEGIYRLCLYARRIVEGQPVGDASDRTGGCATFTVCHLGAPQFTQPVNNLNMNSSIPVLNPSNPVNFSWLPPQSTCGLEGTSGPFSYDFEIREILESQTVTDAINYNPFVFRKASLPSSVFLLDTNLYRNILQKGRRYAIRVRANSANNTIAFENNGFSRVEAFQYGELPFTPLLARPPQSFYIPFAQRKSNFWDDALTAYENKQRKDTSVPINEFISLALARNGIVYSLDAIEMLIALYPDFQENRQEKLSHVPTLPDLPAIPENMRDDFEKEHTVNLKPDSAEERKFIRYADSLLSVVRQRRPVDTSMQMFDSLTGPLNAYGQHVSTADRVSVNNINNLLAEILYVLRLYPPSFKAQYSHLRQLAEDLRMLMSPAFSGLSYLHPMKAKASPLSAYRYTERFTPPSMDQALAFDIIVYHYPKEQPSTPVSTAPGLMAAYKVFYVPSNLYNHKNPEINVKTTRAPASTSQVTLPKLKFKFWTQNLYSQKVTQAQDVDLLDAFLNSGKRWPYPKRFAIVIKVD